MLEQTVKEFLEQVEVAIVSNENCKFLMLVNNQQRIYISIPEPSEIRGNHSVLTVGLQNSFTGDGDDYRDVLEKEVTICLD